MIRARATEKKTAEPSAVFSPSGAPYTVPVTVSVPVPGAVDQRPVSGSCVKEAAGTVTAPAIEANAPVPAL